MGQRHQLFVIANIKDRYRSLAAVHHQWLYGLTALQTCYRLIQIFQDAQNRSLLEHEIDNAASLAEEEWESPVEWDSAPKFPFITTCLVLGAALDLDSGYSSCILTEPWNMAFDGGDNNDGITILDISQQESISYCFMHLSCERELEVNIDMMTLQGSEYLCTYYDKSEWAATMEEAAISLDQLPIISIEVLRETWPHGNFLPRNEASLPEPKLTAAAASSECEALSGTLPRSLTIQSMEVVIEQMLDNVDLDDEALLEVELLPNFQSHLRAYLYARPNVILDRPFGLPVLHRAFKQARLKELDLRPFTSLSADHILSILESNKSKEVALLDLSGNHNITLKDVGVILADVSVENLYLWNNKRISESPELSSVFGKAKYVYHPGLFLGAFKQRWMRGNVPPARIDNSNAATLSLATNNASIQQIIWIRSPCKDLSGEPTNAQSKLFDAAYRDTLKVKDFYGRILTRFVYTLGTLHNAPLDKVQLSVRLPRLMSFLAKKYIDELGDATTRLAFAECFALGNTASNYAVSPLPPTMYRTAKASYHASNRSSRNPMQPLRAKAYTILLIQDIFKKADLDLDRDGTDRFRYAFLTQDDGGRTKVLDIRAFLLETGSLEGLSHWEERIAKITTTAIKGEYPDEIRSIEPVQVAVCDEETVDNVLALVDVAATLEKELPEWLRTDDDVLD